MRITTDLARRTMTVAVVTAVTLAGCSVDIDLADDTTRRVANETAAAAGLTAVDVSTENGAIEVVGGATGEIAVRIVMRESDEGDADYSIDTEGDRLVVRGECDDDRCQVSFELTVPDDVDLVADTRNGGIDLDGLTGDLDVETDNGAIDADRLESSSLRARTRNGAIELTFDRSPDDVEAITNNGRVSVRFPDEGGAHDVDASTDNGSVDVEVRTDPDADRRIVAESNNGAVSVEYRATD